MESRKLDCGQRPFKVWAVLVLLASCLCFARARQSPPAQTSQQLIDRAKEAEQKRDFPAAARFYHDYLKGHPDDSTILQRLGLVECLANRYEAAVRPLAEALRLDPSLWGSALYLGISYYRTDRFPEAVAALKRALALKPGLPDAEFWLGSALLATDQPESAIPYLLSLKDNANWGVEAQSLLIKAYRKAAEDHYRRIAAVAPDSARVHLVQAQVLQWKGVSYEALWEAKQALKRDANLEGAHRLIAEIYWDEKHFDVAAKEFQAELQINPLDPESNLRLGEFWLAKSEAAKALPFLRTAADLGAGGPGEAHHFLGEAELAERDYAKAAGDLQQAVQENPGDAANHQLLAKLYQATGQSELAAKEERLGHSLPQTSPAAAADSSPHP
ncbi:MAG TPA: tetratricopeptide repeat protein [Terriglobia bacterium]|nr:tetratricopeptide repeat protein [Terriglobia bacterium]